MMISTTHFLCGSTIAIIAVLYIYVTQQEEFAILENQLLVANTTTIHKPNLTNKTLDVLYTSDNLQNFWLGGLDCSYELDDSLYFSDMANSKLYALKNKSSEPRVVFSGYENWFPICLAVEDVTGKLYVGDLVQGGLTVHDLDTGDSSVILGAGLLLCVAVAVDVDEKYIFVVDKYQILRLDLDGTNPKTILHSPDKSTLQLSGRRFRNGPQTSRVYIGVDGMTLDRRQKRIYWASARSRSIESSNYDGDDRKVYFKDVAVTFGEARSSSNSLAVIDDVVYWADPYAQRIVKIKSMEEFEILYEGLDHATMASCEKREIVPTSPCGIENGGCQQMCLLARNYYGYSCGCKFGYEIDEDGKSCKVVEEFLLFLEGNTVKGLSLNEKPEFVLQPPGFRANENSAIDFDVESGVIYYVEKVGVNEIKLHVRRIDGKGSPKALTPDLFGRQVTNFAFDWTTKNLYYLSQYYSDAMTLNVMNTQDPTYAKVLVKNVFDDSTAIRFYGPIIHPNKGYLYLGMVGGKSGRGEIKRMNMDGSDFKVIYRAGTKSSIGGLTVDYEEDRIYWGEVRESGSIYWQSSIKNSNLDGGDIREFDLTKHIEMPIGMTIHRGYVYGIDVGKRLFRMQKSGRNLRILAESGYFGYNVKLYSHNLQPIQADHPCQNKKCDKFCFAIPHSQSNKLKAICSCPYGQKLADDGISCVDDLRNQPTFRACEDRSSCKITTAV